MIGYKNTSSESALTGTGTGRRWNLQRSLRLRDCDTNTSPSDNGTNELIANLDHELLDVRVRAVKCLLRKLECGIVSSGALKDRVDLLDRCIRWLSSVLGGPQKQGQETQTGKEVFTTVTEVDPAEKEGIEVVFQLILILAEHKDFRDLLRQENVDILLSKALPFISGDYKHQLEALHNALVVGQYELRYEGEPTEWNDNKTHPDLSSRSKLTEMFSSRYKPYGAGGYSNYEDSRSSPFATAATAALGGGEAGELRSTRTTPEQTAKKSSLPLSTEDGWIQNIQFFVPSVTLTGTDKRVIHSTTESLSGTNETLALMTVTFIRDTLTLDYPPELFLQESSLLLSLAQVTVSRWTDRRIPYVTIQTLLKISNLLRFRFTQLNSPEQYQVPQTSYDMKPSNSYYDNYDAMSYSSRYASSKTTPSAATAATDALVENFIQLFKSFSRALHYTSYDIHLWPVYDSFAFTLYKLVSIFPVDSKALTLSLQSALMELSHVWERKSDFNTTVGLCLVCSSILNSMKFHNETFIVSKDVRNMLRNLSYSSIIRNGWTEIFNHFIQFSSMFDPSSGIISASGSASEQTPPPSGPGDTNGKEKNNPKEKLLKYLYAVQNAGRHEDVLESVMSLRDVLVPIVLNVRLGEDSLSHILKDLPWRDTFYRFLCIEPTTEGDEELLGDVLDLFTYILQNVVNAGIFKWITPLCFEKSCQAIKLLGNTALKKEPRYGGTALPDLLRSLIDFYSVAMRFGNVLVPPETRWEIFQVYVAILDNLEQGSYSNFALLTAIAKELASITQDGNVQTKMKENPVVAVALVHRITDAIIVLDANGSLFEGFKNSCGLYYLSICLVHVLIPVMKNDNFKNFRGDWIERVGRAFHIFSVSPDARVKAQSFQVCEVLSSISEAKKMLIEIVFKDSINSILEIAYGAFVDQKHPSSVKFRAGNVLFNLLKDESEKVQHSLAKRLHQGFAVLADLSRLSSRVLWHSKLSAMVKNSKASEKSSNIMPVYNEGIPFITPKVLTRLCKILNIFIKSLLFDPKDRAQTLQEVTSSGICQMMYRIILLHPLKTEEDPRVWLEVCCAVSSVVEALINLSKLDRAISIILIGEKKCLSTMFGLLELEVPSSAKNATLEKAEEALTTLCSNVLNLATILSCDAGNNFEDLERVAWSFQPVLFTKLTKWLNVTTPVISKKSALSFSQAFLSALSNRTKVEAEVHDRSEDEAQHPFLCRPWNGNLTYGQALSENLNGILKDSVDLDERISAIKSLAALFSLSPSSVRHAVEENDIVHFCVMKLHGFGSKFFEAKMGSKKNTSLIHTETIAFMELLSSIFYVSNEAKGLALRYNFPDVLHKIFGWWSMYPDLSLLHIYIEALLNFTEEFPQGALAMIMTSNVPGVGPRRVPTPQSIFLEILAILEKELSNVENHPNLKPVEIIFELLKNICFVQECRNILLKSPVMLFLRKLHSQETKKWGKQAIAVKVCYLDFLVHASAHSDVQTCIAKTPEALEILLQLVESDQPPSSTSALKVLRNLCFQPSNRGRLISENMLVPSLSNKLSQSANLDEIENACISIWALIANFEKGRLHAKKSYCHESISKALERIRKLEQTGQDDVSRLISLLEIVQRLMSGTSAGMGPSSSGFAGSKLSINSRSSSGSGSQLHA